MRPVDIRYPHHQVRFIVVLLHLQTQNNIVIDASDPFGANYSSIVHPNPLDPSTIVRLQTWIRQCDQEHESCHGERPPTMPTRVLDLGYPNSYDNVKLLETNGQRGNYIALSHCWGTTNSFLTTRETFQSMKNGFNPENVPATFRDSISLARSLQIQYLWIDSLCIIQRDKADWDMESSRMGDVYRNAYLVVAASNAADDSEGFLKIRPKIQCSVKVTAPTGQGVNVYLRPTEDRNRPLDTRGWTLQESYLARRLLRVTDSTFMWNCQVATYDESNSKFGGGPWRSVAELLPSKDSHYNTPYQKWYSMISGFSARKFSVQSDRLPALSGLVAVVAAQKKEKYCAGLWWEDIGYAICWRAGHYGCIRPDSYLAPSWSWASVIGEILFPEYVSSPIYRVNHLDMLDSVIFHDYQASLRGSNMYGEIECAWLEVEAPFAPLFKVEGIRKRVYGPVEYYSMDPIWGAILQADLLEIQFDVKEHQHQGLFALFVMHRMGKPGSGIEFGASASDDLQLSGVILREALDEEKIISEPKKLDSYKRVGFFNLSTSQAKDSLLQMAPITRVILL